jgi:hypothetical protein
MSFELFNLLPAIYRIRDGQLAATMNLLTPAEQTQLNSLQTQTTPLTAQQQSELDNLLAKAERGPLESLLLLIQEQIAAVDYDLGQLYDDQFIETCAPWVIPYIGDLIGYQSVSGIAPAIDNPRAEVAETISLRRRKGTVLVLEQLARDATGWGAHAVEFFQILADTQYMNHPRLFNHYAPDLRRSQPGLYPALDMDTGFDRTAHTVDVRSIAAPTLVPLRSRYNIQNIGIFLWSLAAYPITGAAATPCATNAAHGQLCYRFSPLGMDIPLFHPAVSQGEDITALAQPVNVPDRLRRRVLCDDIQKGVGAGYYGTCLELYLGGNLLNPYQILVADLAGSDGSWANLPGSGSTCVAALDPELGRIALSPSAPAGDLTVTYNYGFNANLGGGEYARAVNFIVTNPACIVAYPGPGLIDLQHAINQAIGLLSDNGQAAVEIAGSQTFAMTGPLVVDLPKGATFELRSADPARGTLLLDGELAVSGDQTSTFVLNGLVVSASPAMTPATATSLLHVPAARPTGSANLLSNLNVTDCTLVPGWSVAWDGTPNNPTAPAIRIDASAVTVSITTSIVGAIQSGEFSPVSLRDSILDATDPTLVAYSATDGASGGGPLTMHGTTAVGMVHATLLSMVSNSIVWAALPPAPNPPPSTPPVFAWPAALVADRKQQGCVRFSFLPFNAVTPRPYECVTQALASPQPYFASLRYGHPAYMKLLACTGDSIRRGAHNGGEMGASHALSAPQRESDLQIRITEYLPVGLEFGLIYQS